MENVPVLERSLGFKYFNLGKRMSFARQMKKKLRSYQFNQWISNSKNEMPNDVDLTIKLFHLEFDVKEKNVTIEKLESFECELLDILSTLLDESIAELEKVSNLPPST